ncbi:MAG: hypothetical protein Q8942_08220, partial [Bacillota bacterium]|nr:hypothetical protein [Bacillota bacterium]
MWKFIKHLIKTMGEEQVSDSNPSKPENNQMIKGGPSEKTNIPKRYWKKEYNPLRQILIWGWDENNNPSFMVLYGLHEFEQRKNSLRDGLIYTLRDYVTYNSYAVFKGSGGHLPSFKPFKMVESSKEPGIYFKKGIEFTWNWNFDNINKYNVSNKSNLEKNSNFSKFDSVTYSLYVSELMKHAPDLSGFKPAKDPNEILKLEGPLAQFSELIIKMMSDERIYTRKKLLSALIDKNPSREIYSKLLDIGSSELICGLFLELAKRSNPILKDEAIQINDSDISWA